MNNDSNAAGWILLVLIIWLVGGSIFWGMVIGAAVIGVLNLLSIVTSFVMDRRAKYRESDLHAFWVAKRKAQRAAAIAAWRNPPPARVITVLVALGMIAFSIYRLAPINI